MDEKDAIQESEAHEWSLSEFVQNLAVFVGKVQVSKDHIRGRSFLGTNDVLSDVRFPCPAAA